VSRHETVVVVGFAGAHASWTYVPVQLLHCPLLQVRVCCCETQVCPAGTDAAANRVRVWVSRCAPPTHGSPWLEPPEADPPEEAPPDDVPPDDVPPEAAPPDEVPPEAAPPEDAPPDDDPPEDAPPDEVPPDDAPPDEAPPEAAPPEEAPPEAAPPVEGPLPPLAGDSPPAPSPPEPSPPEPPLLAPPPVPAPPEFSVVVLDSSPSPQPRASAMVAPATTQNLLRIVTFLR
jgi:hypothetical protein